VDVDVAVDVADVDIDIDIVAIVVHEKNDNPHHECANSLVVAIVVHVVDDFSSALVVYFDIDASGAGFYLHLYIMFSNFLHWNFGYNIYHFAGNLVAVHNGCIVYSYFLDFHVGYNMVVEDVSMGDVD
jgi:hypothetical protein